jgi:hypothetical protein
MQRPRHGVKPSLAPRQPLVRVRPRRKRNEDGGVPPNGALNAPDVSKTIR